MDFKSEASEVKIKEEPDNDFSDVPIVNTCDNYIKVEIIESENEREICNTCEITFINREELKIHNMIHSKNHTCFVCNEFVKNRFQFVGHVRKHMCTKPFQCPSCIRTFTTWRETKLHQRVHSDDRPFMCTECGKAFKQISTLRDHEVVHTGEKRFKCKICEGAFATSTSLRRHIRVMHETVRIFRCHYCDKEFSSKEAVQVHTAIHKNEDPLKCRLCGETLHNQEEFTLHRNRHIELKQSGNCEYCGNKTFYFDLKDHIEKMHRPRTCEICSLVFYDTKSMDNHIKSHMAEPMKEEFVCPVCQKQFEFPRYLKAHMKRHDEDYKKFKCDVCDKNFCSRRDLTDHLNVHSNVKNYHCNICDKAFRTKQSVSKHMPIHSENRPYQCRMCDKSFKKQSILRKHTFTHSRVRPYECEVCHKTYKSKESLRVHRFTHNKVKIYCDKCGKGFKYKADYRSHCCGKTVEIYYRRCNFCRKPCKTSKTYASHILGHSKTRKFRCNICKVHLKYQYRLIMHDMMHKR